MGWGWNWRFQTCQGHTQASFFLPCLCFLNYLSFLNDPLSWAIGDSAWARAWAQWSPEFPAILGHSVLWGSVSWESFFPLLNSQCLDPWVFSHAFVTLSPVPLREWGWAAGWGGHLPARATPSHPWRDCSLQRSQVGAQAKQEPTLYTDPVPCTWVMASRVTCSCNEQEERSRRESWAWERTGRKIGPLKISMCPG